jgi:hypothetical protein
MVAVPKGTNGMNGIKAFERAALDAFRNGIGWNEYWQQHANEIRQAEPWSMTTNVISNENAKAMGPSRPGRVRVSQTSGGDLLRVLNYFSG